MTGKIVWDATAERFFEAGVDHVVLYIPSVSGVYDTGFAWNGVTSITESPSGAEPTKIYADNLNYVTLTSLEEFSATLEALTYPDAFGQCDGSASPVVGVNVSGQPRKRFGLSFRTRLGNDVVGDTFGYKLHLLWGLAAAPSEKAYNTINDSPETTTFSWELSSTPVSAGALNPTSSITIRSDKVTAPKLTALETILYGQTTPTIVEPKLPTPAEIITMMAP